MTFKCFKCGQEIVFSPMQVGKNGKKIPLDPATELPHDCPMRDKPTQPQPKEEKKSFDEVADQIRNDHGNETYQAAPDLTTGQRPLVSTKPIEGYVDHTAARPSKVKLFKGTVNEVETAYNEFLATPNRFAWTRAQLQFDNGVIVIALYYEESK